MHARSHTRTQNERMLQSEQAMADYVELIWELKHELKAVDAPVIGELLVKYYLFGS